MILDALLLLFADRFEFDWHGDVLDIDLSADEVRSHLDNFDFSILAGKILVEHDAVPGALKISYKVKVKAAGYICIIHKNDADPFPSNPHAHMLELNLKLDLRNGTLYKKRRAVDAVGRKDLIAIRNAASKVYKGDLPELQPLTSS